MRSGKKNMRFENVLGNRGVFFFPRRAHLLTTSSAVVFPLEIVRSSPR